MSCKEEVTEDNEDAPSTSTLSPKTTSKPKMKKSGKSGDLLSKGSDCPEGCSCNDKKVSCRKLKSIPSMLKSSSATEVDLCDSNLDSMDFSLLPATLEQLDASNSTIKIISIPRKLETLRKLNLSNNQLELLKDLSKLPSLEVLDLSNNPIKNINDAFAPLTQLKTLNLSGIKAPFNHGQFSQNQKLQVLDLSNCGLVDVPPAIRNTNSIKRLTMNGNNMTSLRQSDFMNCTSIEYLEMRKCPHLKKIDESTFSRMGNLKNLVISDNPKLCSISPEAFMSPKNIDAEMIDLRNNNISTLPDLRTFPSLNFETMLLSGNPWLCNCDLNWLETFPKLHRSPMHCKRPEQFKDMLVSQFLSVTDCDMVESNYHIFILTGFLLFLFGLLVAVVVQKSDMFRRFLWKDQYGTIYYTKANFPQDTPLEA